jgi:hypothetical protein
MRLNTTNITDDATRLCLQDIQDEFNNAPILQGQFKLLEFTLAANLANSDITHNLGFIPTDIIPTRSEGTYTWNWSSFTVKTLSINTTTAVTLRLLVGRITSK